MERPAERPCNGELVPGRNGGLIRRGNAKGCHKGGPGRPPDQVRQAWMEMLNGKGTARLESCMESSDDATALRAIEITARHSLSTKVELTNMEIFRCFARNMARAGIDAELAERVTDSVLDELGVK